MDVAPLCSLDLECSTRHPIRNVAHLGEVYQRRKLAMSWLSDSQAGMMSTNHTPGTLASEKLLTAASAMLTRGSFESCTS